MVLPLCRGPLTVTIGVSLRAAVTSWVTKRGKSARLVSFMRVKGFSQFGLMLRLIRITMPSSSEYMRPFRIGASTPCRATTLEKTRLTDCLEGPNLPASHQKTRLTSRVKEVKVKSILRGRGRFGIE